MFPIAPTTELISELSAGRMIILVDEENRENEGDLVIAADHVTPDAINFMARFARGLICLTLTEARCQQLKLPLMVRHNRAAYGTNFTVSIEAAAGVSTGISAADRARTVQAAVAAHAQPEDLVQPGHIFPIMAQPGGVLVRAGHTEAGCDLCQLAHLTPAAVICEIMNEDGTMARLPQLQIFAQQHGLKIGTITDLIQYRFERETIVEHVGERPIRTVAGQFLMQWFRDKTTNQVHIALVYGEIHPNQAVLVRVHALMSPTDLIDIDPGIGRSWAAPSALAAIAAAQCGVLLLLAQSEPTPLDFSQRTTEAPTGRWDAKTFGVGAQILRALGVGKLRLMTQPQRIASVIGFGLEIVGYEVPSD